MTLYEICDFTPEICRRGDRNYRQYVDSYWASWLDGRYDTYMRLQNIIARVSTPNRMTPSKSIDEVNRIDIRALVVLLGISLTGLDH